jgi:succinate-acetate transporter protein
MPTEILENRQESEQQQQAPARIYLQPIAAPSILGLYALAASTFIVAAHMAGWYGDLSSALYLFPFASIFGGVAQFLAGMWSFRARDGVAAAMHGLWGSLFIAYGIIVLVFAIGNYPLPANRFPELGYTLAVTAAITWVGAYAASAENKSFSTTLGFFAAGATLGAIGSFTGSGWVMIWTGYILLAGSVLAWYTGSALMVNEAFGRDLWGLGKSRQLREMPRVSIGMGEPGVIRGQA